MSIEFFEIKHRNLFESLVLLPTTTATNDEMQQLHHGRGGLEARLENIYQWQMSDSKKRLIHLAADDIFVQNRRNSFSAQSKFSSLFSSSTAKVIKKGIFRPILIIDCSLFSLSLRSFVECLLLSR